MRCKVLSGGLLLQVVWKMSVEAASPAAHAPHWGCACVWLRWVNSSANRVVFSGLASDEGTAAMLTEGTNAGGVSPALSSGLGPGAHTKAQVA